ncbi:hypothetical protein P171DRAFT_179772 [Karstenula rhodostoma CBS 690.94]|uniref:Uncharacterized protein n=1 Tax=Karstenula rhodostoma CBS 690.94 TaxID=1392251 RepID=A0A9P4P3I5_9PLEO|nr:hypothetical protein P171DRAFT_179772 [Karstenula rhodostoma CBS 690.94]
MDGAACMPPTLASVPPEPLTLPAADDTTEDGTAPITPSEQWVPPRVHQTSEVACTRTRTPRACQWTRCIVRRPQQRHHAAGGWHAFGLTVSRRSRSARSRIGHSCAGRGCKPAPEEFSEEIVPSEAAAPRIRLTPPAISIPRPPILAPRSLPSPASFTSLWLGALYGRCFQRLPHRSKLEMLGCERCRRCIHSFPAGP